MITDNTAMWQLKKVTDFNVAKSALPIGHIYQSLNPNVPLGSLPLFGGLYDRNLYKDLWTWVQEQPNFLVSESEWQSLASSNGGNVPKFSTGDGSTTFRVPSMKCWVKSANGIKEVGSYLSAGLPNVKGHITTRKVGETVNYESIFADEVLFTKEDFSSGYSKLYPADSTDSASRITLDLSGYNPIYGNSDTVQPPSIVGMWLIVAYGSVSNLGNVDIADAMQAFEDMQNNYLPLSGGIMSGAIEFPIDGSILENENSIEVRANDIGGGRLTLCRTDFEANPGGFQIRADNGDTAKYLMGFADGTLTWNGEKVALGENFYLGNNEACTEVIPAGADLNNYTTAGTYLSRNATNSATLVNTPYTSGNFKLVVVQNLVGYLSQLLMTSNKNYGYYVRYKNGDSVEWSAWINLGVGSAYKIPYATSSTAYGNGAKVATITNGVSFSLVAGARVAVKFTASSGYSSADGSKVTWTSLNVNSTGAKTINAWSRYAADSNEFKQAGGVYEFVYDGTNWNLVTFNMYRS